MDNNYTHIPNKLLSRRQSLMLHALGFVTGDPSVRIDYPYVFHPGLQVTVNEPGDSKWIYMMLPVTRGSLITDIKIAYHRTGLQSHITHIRLVEQREPVSATVVHNEIIEEITPVTDVIRSACHVVVNHSILLKVCMDFADTDDMIELGSVEVRYIPEYASLPEHKRKEVQTGKHGEKSTINMFSIAHSLNMHRPSFMELFLQKKGKKKVSF